MASGGVLVQYVVVRSDLLHVLKWPFGAVITQACHASSAVLHRFYTDANTEAYLSDVDRMHKVVLQTADESGLRQLAEVLTVNGVDHKLWIEQPENIATCLATKPYPKQEIQQHFSTLKLFK